MFTILRTDEFDSWLKQLDNLARAKVLVRMDRVGHGNFGDVDSVGDGVLEMRVDFGPGYRIYFAREHSNVYLLLLGGDKSTQRRDIRRAKQLWSAIKRTL